MNPVYRRSINITLGSGKTIFNTKQIKILGLFVNAKNDMSKQLSFIISNTMFRLRSYKEILAASNSDQKKYIVKSYIMPLMTYCLPMFIGQITKIKEGFKVTLNKLYRIMYEGSSMLIRSETIYKEIKMPAPTQLIAQQSVTKQGPG